MEFNCPNSNHRNIDRHYCFMGKDIFTSSSTLGTVNAEKTNQLFFAIKTIIKWALWGLFGFWVIKNGKAFIDKMTGGQ